MTTKDLKADANALMNLEMMDAVLGGASASGCSNESCSKACVQECKPMCKQGCGNSGKTKRKKKK